MLLCRLFILVIAFAATATTLVSGAHASVPSERFDDAPADALASIPRSVEVVLIVDRFGEVFGTALSEAAWKVVSDLARVTDESKYVLSVQENWTRLGTELGMTRRDAVDRLVGTRLVFASRDGDRSDARRWAVLSVISEQTDREMVSRLRPARRGIVEGHAIRTIEGGHYEVATHLHEAPAEPNGQTGKPALGKARNRAVSLLLAESGRSELFDEIVGVWSGRVAKTLAHTDLAREAARFADAQILLAIRLDPESPSDRRAEHDWTNFLLLTGRVTDDGLELHAVLRDQHHHAQLAGIRPWSAGPFEAMGHNAALAVVESRLDHEAQAGRGGQSPVRSAFTSLGLNDPLQDLLAGRQMLIVQDNPAAVGKASAPIGVGPTVFLGAETHDIGALSKLGDLCINENVAKMQGIPVNASLNLAGISCESIRRTRVNVPGSERIAQLLGTPVDIAWTYVSTGTVQGAGKPRSAGWWLVSMGSKPQPASAPGGPVLVSRAAHPDAPRTITIESCREVVRLPVAAGDDEVRRWYSVGVLRPARLLRVLSPMLPTFGLEETLGQFESLEWRLFVTPSNDIEGSLKLRVMSPKDRTIPGAGEPAPR